MAPRRKPRKPQKKPVQEDYGIVVKVESLDELALECMPEKVSRPKRIIRKSKKYADYDEGVGVAANSAKKMDNSQSNSKKSTCSNTKKTNNVNRESAVVEIMEQRYDSDSSSGGFKDDSGDEDYSMPEKKSRATKFSKQTKLQQATKSGENAEPAARSSKRGKLKIEDGIIDTRIPENAVEGIENIDSKEHEKILSLVKIPRSKENSKFKEVYKTLPKMRSSSPPRFTTKGIKKVRLDTDGLGIRIVGRTLGNPFSSHHKRRNGVVYGNQALNTAEELEKYAGAAINVRQAVKKQAEHLRISSYVQPKVLHEVRRQNGMFKTTKENIDNIGEEGEVDIETPDDANLRKGLMKRKRTARVGGRKPGRAILECKECGYKTTHSGHMKIHIISVHRDLKPHECKFPGCDYKCSRKGSMTRHEKCVHRKDKVLKCDQCSFESAWSVSLERHIITKHLKLRPWTCEVCKKSFGQQFTLTQHMTTVHKKIKRIRCAFCSYRASTKVNVRQHILRMHQEEIQAAMEGADDDNEEDVDVTEQ